jgi:hypothetical protein
MRKLLMSSLLFLAPIVAAADEPELLPPPRALSEPAPEILLPLPPAAYRPDPRAVWQAYAVDSRGYFRPAIGLEPFPHYRATGMPYYHLPTRTAR